MPSLTGLGASSTSALASFRPRPGGGAHDLDYLDLLVAGAGQHHVHRGGAFVFGGRLAAATAGCRDGRSHGGGGDAELLLERFDALGELEHGDALELLDPSLGVWLPS